MNIILFDDAKRINFLPLSYTRPIGDLRVGILTIAQKWEAMVDASASFLTQDYLSQKFTTKYSDNNIYLNGRVIPNKLLALALDSLQENTTLMKDGEVIAFRSKNKLASFTEIPSKGQEYSGPLTMLNFTYDIFSLNGQEIKSDYDLMTQGRTSAALDKTNTCIGSDIFIEEGAQIQGAILDTSDGPIYIGKDSKVLIGSLVKGPFALCDNAVLKMGAKIYGATTVGPYCKIGGEVSNVVFHGYSNKGHDGFLGNSVIGEWCNLGADTNSSNLKNNYAEVKLWNYESKRFLKTGLQFCGLVMGDHSKCGINTMFNTGTVVGVSANVFGAGFPRNFIPSFTWGGSSGFATYTMGKAFETADKVMQRRAKEFDGIERQILIQIFEQSSEHRFWETSIKRT